MIAIHAYKSSWPEEYETIRADLREALGALARRIDHIGSTSVPGLGAKDVIDIQVTVLALEPAIKEKLIQAGYQHRSVHTHDRVLMGEDPNPELWAKYVFEQPEGRRRANIHVRVEGNPNQRYALLFRDYLRAHPKSARYIELIKRELASRHAQDKVAYYAVKDPVYDLVWDAALEWAGRSGWRPAG